MTTEISKLLTEITAFIKIIESKKTSVLEIMGKLEKNIQIIRNQSEVYAVSKRATVPPKMLKNFPDVKQRLLSKLNLIIEEEIEEMTRHIDHLSEFSEELQKRSNKMEKQMTQIKWKEYNHFYVPVFRMFEWADKCWRYFRIICTNLRNSLTAVIIDDTHSITHFKYTDTINDVNKEYIFNNPVVKMFRMLQVDFSSRSKISVKSSVVTR